MDFIFNTVWMAQHLTPFSPVQREFGDMTYSMCIWVWKVIPDFLNAAAEKNKVT